MQLKKLALFLAVAAAPSAQAQDQNPEKYRLKAPASPVAPQGNIGGSAAARSGAAQSPAPGGMRADGAARSIPGAQVPGTAAETQPGVAARRAVPAGDNTVGTSNSSGTPTGVPRRSRAEGAGPIAGGAADIPRGDGSKGGDGGSYVVPGSVLTGSSNPKGDSPYVVPGSVVSGSSAAGNSKGGIIGESRSVPTFNQAPGGQLGTRLPAEQTPRGVGTGTAQTPGGVQGSGGAIGMDAVRGAPGAARDGRAGAPGADVLRGGAGGTQGARQVGIDSQQPRGAGGNTQDARGTMDRGGHDARGQDPRGSDSGSSQGARTAGTDPRGSGQDPRGGGIGSRQDARGSGSASTTQSERGSSSAGASSSTQQERERDRSTREREQKDRESRDSSSKQAENTKSSGSQDKSSGSKSDTQKSKDHSEKSTSKQRPMTGDSAGSDSRDGGGPRVKVGGLTTNPAPDESGKSGGGAKSMPKGTTGPGGRPLDETVSAGRSNTMQRMDITSQPGLEPRGTSEVKPIPKGGGVR